MSHHADFVRRAALLGALGACLAVPACSEEEPPERPPLDSSYLQSLEKEGAREKPAPPAPEAEPEAPEAEPQAPEEEPERELRAQQESRSTLGRTRDRARDLRNQITGGATTDSRLADTGYDEHWIEVRGLHWDVPEAWTIAIPSDPSVKGELVIRSELGNAIVLFTETRADAAQAVQSAAGTMLDGLGSAHRVRPSREEIGGRVVHRASVEGTFVDPSDRGGREQPFWALHAAAVELGPRESVLIVMRGPAQTVEQNLARWDDMIEGMTER